MRNCCGTALACGAWSHVLQHKEFTLQPFGTSKWHLLKTVCISLLRLLVYQKRQKAEEARRMEREMKEAQKEKEVEQAREEAEVSWNS